MTPALQSVTEGLVGRLARWFGMSRDVRELHNIGTTEVASIARDLRVPVGELEKLAAHGRGAGELPQLLQQLGFDETEIAQKHPDVLRDMSIVCALCVAKARCSHDLDRGSADLNYDRYCPNGQTIGALRRARMAEHVALYRGPSCC